MNRFFWKKVGLDFGRTFLGFYSVAISAALAGALTNVEAADFSLASWKPLAVALGVAAGSAAIRALQALKTNLETDAAN